MTFNRSGYAIVQLMAANQNTAQTRPVPWGLSEDIAMFKPRP
jgi:hypothetical protein